MPSAVGLQEGCSAEDLRGLARRSRDVNQSRHLYRWRGFEGEWTEGRRRGSAASTAQTLREWVHRFNAIGTDGLFDNSTEGPKPRLSSAQMAEVARIVERARSTRKTASCASGVSISSVSIAEREFGVDFHERYVGTLLKKLPASRTSALGPYPAQDEPIVEGFKKRMSRPVCKGFVELGG